MALGKWFTGKCVCRLFARARVPSCYMIASTHFIEILYVMISPTAGAIGLALLKLPRRCQKRSETGVIERARSTGFHAQPPSGGARTGSPCLYVAVRVSGLEKTLGPSK